MITTGIDECGIATHPKKPQYLKMNNIRFASYDNRLKTFKKWPKSYPEYQVTSICDAGFFYTGVSDKIECFCCGARLSNWTDSDVALDQHIIWSPNCPFLKIIKGIKHIQETRAKFVIREIEGDEVATSAEEGMTSTSAAEILRKTL